MNTKFVLAFFLAVSTLGFSQRSELKQAAKSFKAGDIDATMATLKSVEGTIGAANIKYQSQFYYLKSAVLSKGSSDESIEGAAEAFAKLFELEKANGESKFGQEARVNLVALKRTLDTKAIADNNQKRYKNAAKKFVLLHKLDPKDTISLFYAASNTFNDKDYETAVSYYTTLKELGFTGVSTQFLATRKEDGEVLSFPSDEVRKSYIKKGDYENPINRKTKSRTADLAKYLTLSYIELGKEDEAMKVMEEAKRENPNDTALLYAQADVFYSLKKLDEYGKVMQQIIASDPNNPDLYYNLGVTTASLGDNNKAMEYYNKALELKPDYTSAQINIASIYLAEGASIVTEMNSLGTSKKDYRRYDVLKEKRNEVYKKAVPYLEGALKSTPDNTQAIRILMNIYDQLDDPKGDDMRNKLKALEGGN